MILYGVTIVCSAFLLFLVQPIVAKQILPWFGGSAAVWTVCVVFFQAVLLAGYAYAHGLVRRGGRTQAFLHIALLVISLASLPIIASASWKPLPGSDPTWRIAGLLAATIGLPYFLLSSTGPLMQSWVANDPALASRRAGVYRLFALSNLGSLVGLLAYPFAVEPFASLDLQASAWSGAYACFVLVCGVSAWRVRARRPDAREASDRQGAPSFGRSSFWLACAALGSMLLLAVTNHVTQNVASIPFLWVLPLALYLLSFVIVFEGRDGRGWYVRRWWLAPVLAAAIAMTWALGASRGVLNLYVSLPIFCIGLFLCCVFCHGELAATKPKPAYLTHFYLCLSAGGALGGLFVALVAPQIFTNYWETPGALVGLSVIAAISLRERRLSGWLAGIALATVAIAAVFLAGGGNSFAAVRKLLPGGDATGVTVGLVVIAAAALSVATWKQWPVAIVATAVVCTAVYAHRYYDFLSKDTLVASRNFYGALRVKDSGSGTEQRRDLLHGVILHGDQYLSGDRRHDATTYYGPDSGIGLVLQKLRTADEQVDVAMIGLGTGTLTAWGEAGDRYRIYELNPAMVEIAQRDFTYLTDSKADLAIVLGDARLSMERELRDGTAVPFDVIAVDAFSSDSIPVHLITREALDVFRRHLKPDGVIAFHVSNRFLDLAPVVAQLAADAGLMAFNVVDNPDDEVEYAASDWVLVTNNRAFVDSEAIRARLSSIDPIPGLPIWTDQYNNLFKILK